MYKNYIFDLYGTLIDINTDEWSAKLWKSLQILYAYHGAEYTPQEIKREYGRLVDKEKASVRRRHPEFTVIDVKIEKVFRALFTQKGVKVPKSRIDFIAEAFRCYSNAQRVFTENELNMFGLDKYFDGVCISSDEECSKPDAHYYQTLFDRYGLKKEESIMIGNDYISDIGGAADFGIDSLYIHQSISPEIKGELRSQYTVMDGDVYKIKKLIVKE